MKKIIISLFIVVILAACGSTPQYVVTVVGKSKSLASRGRALVDNSYYSVVTASGDTLEALVPETIAFRNTLPYRAVMEKGNGTTVGTIVRAAPAK
jgi:hypothetical protein